MGQPDEELKAMDIRSKTLGAKPAVSGDACNQANLPCFVNFLRGKCKNKSCKYDHDYAVMLKVTIWKFKVVAQSKFAPDKAYAVKLSDKAYEEAAKNVRRFCQRFSGQG